LKYAKLETNTVTYESYGDTGVARGVSPRLHSASASAPDPQPFTVFYTLTFVNKDGAWKAIAMHTSKL
jgi:hypothetical protein